MTDETIPIAEVYLGWFIHADQPAERVNAVVKPAIDLVLAQNDVRWMAAYCGNPDNPPEARLLAAARCHLIFEQAVEERRERPELDLAQIDAQVAGLNSVRWRDPLEYCSLFDACRRTPGRQFPKRETPLCL